MVLLIVWLFIKNTLSACEFSTCILHDSNLDAAYQDFIAYRTVSPDAYHPTLNSAIAFAHELGVERELYGFAYQMLNNDKTLNPLAFSKIDHELIHSLLVWTPLPQIADMLENSALSPWIIDEIYRVYSQDFRLFNAAKMLSNPNAETKQQAVIDLLSLLEHPRGGSQAQGYAAVVLTQIENNESQSFLSEGQKENICRSLIAAIQSSTYSSLEHIIFAGAALNIANSKERQYCLNVLFYIMRSKTIPVEQRMIAAHRLALEADERQKQQAISVIIDLNQMHLNKHIFLPPIAHLYLSEIFLLTSAQQNAQEIHMQSILQRGRYYKRANILDGIQKSEGISVKVKSDAITQLLMSSGLFLTAQENYDLFQNMLSPKIKGVITEFQKTNAKWRLKALISSLELSSEQKISAVLSIMEGKKCISRNGNTVEEQTIHEGFFLLDSINSSWRPMLARCLFNIKSDYLSLTYEGFNLLYPFLIEELIRDYHSISRECLANSILEMSFITENQRLQVLQVFIDAMNDATLLAQARLINARFIRNSVYSTAEQASEAALLIESPRSERCVAGGAKRKAAGEL